MADWQSATEGQVPPGAFHAGNDHGGPMYCARAFHEGDLIPGKVVPGFNNAYVSYGGEEHTKNIFEVLCGSGFFWTRADANTPVPSNAISAGRTASGENLYIGRVKHGGADVVGKVHRSHARCYIPYGGKEHSYVDFEVLCL